jgi:hypothetical protein
VPRGPQVRHRHARRRTALGAVERVERRARRVPDAPATLALVAHLEAAVEEVLAQVHALGQGPDEVGVQQRGDDQTPAGAAEVAPDGRALRLGHQAHALAGRDREEPALAVRAPVEGPRRAPARTARREHDGDHGREGERDASGMTHDARAHHEACQARGRSIRTSPSGLVGPSSHRRGVMTPAPPCQHDAGVGCALREAETPTTVSRERMA